MNCELSCLHYLYHGRKESTFNQTQQGINDLKHGHHLTEIHHISRAVEGVIERVCGGTNTQHIALGNIYNCNYLQNKSLLCSHVPVSIQIRLPVKHS